MPFATLIINQFVNHTATRYSSLITVYLPDYTELLFLTMHDYTISISVII